MNKGFFIDVIVHNPPLFQAMAEFNKLPFTHAEAADAAKQLWTAEGQTTIHREWGKFFRRHFKDRLRFADGDPFHITICAAESGYDGNDIAQRLRENGCECEYSDSSLVILLMSPVNRSGDYIKLTAALEKALCSAVKAVPVHEAFTPGLPEKAMSVREAVFAPCEDIPVELAEGRICGAVRVPCPPAVPIAASGEIIDRNCINIFKRYGIFTVNVVK